VPYRTSYYSEAWAFCVSERTRSELVEDRYDVVVDTTLAPGSLTYGELLLPGEEEHEVLLTTHVCHPSLANDNCSGIAVLIEIGRLLAEKRHRYSYRLLFIPGTIGSITWLARNESVVRRIRHGIVLTGLGDRGPLTWKRSREGTTTIDRAAEHVLEHSGVPSKIVDFSPYGYDERQFCSPGFDLPVGRLSRTPHSEYPEYHTSADDLTFVDDLALGDSLRSTLAILDVLEADGRYLNTQPKGEPQLGRRGLYRSVGGAIDNKAMELGYLWVLNQSDGTQSLLDIAQRSGMPFDTLRRATAALVDAGLVVPVGLG
jgi:aminopeptidase-like protein